MHRLLPLLLITLAAYAHGEEFTSPDGLTEQCRLLPPMPGVTLSKGDQAKEKELCGIDFYGGAVALCPKTWSTSAAVMVYDIKGSGLAPQAYESQRCATREGHERLAKFKMTMNQRNTSGTMSNSALMYYVLSRYLDTLVEVPVAVYRTIDKEVLGKRVAAHASGQGSMNRSAWEWVRTAVRNPSAYVPTDDLFTADRQQIYGVLLDDKGARYGVEINGPRKAAWGAPQSREVQTTPAVTALRRDATLASAIAGAPYPTQQMVFWMRELSEIAVLDHIFSQQDRVGNIDYVWRWYWVDADGKVQHDKVHSKVPRSRMNSLAVPDELRPFHPMLLQRTWIGDNDAGLSRRYANFSAQTGMVSNLRHFDAGVYRRLMALSRDFQQRGPISDFLAGEIGLKPAQLELMMKNTIDVARILEANCRSGKLRFDLNPMKFLKGEPTEESVDCSGAGV
jgi:hypothetical protein